MVNASHLTELCLEPTYQHLILFYLYGESLNGRYPRLLVSMK